jgi:hypothetical protein
MDKYASWGLKSCGFINANQAAMCKAQNNCASNNHVT